VRLRSVRAAGTLQAGVLDRSAYLFAGLFGLALLAFWPSYLSRLGSGSSGYVHIHAAVMTLWFGLLIAQAVLIRTRRRALHRRLGALSYGLAPIVVVTGVLLTHAALVREAVDDPAGAGMTAYLPLAMLVWFTACYALAIAYRKTPALHARFMIGTCLAAVDPIVSRVAVFYFPRLEDPFRYPLISWGVTAAILLAAIAGERGQPRGRAVFPAMLATSSAMFALWFSLAPSPAWRMFARWFHDLPLT
jgi:hypothetical protein